MQIKRMARKLAAISAGALMLGATLTGAIAYNLADYPAPFVKNGVLDNTVIVVGAKAATSDVVGAIDVAAALQAEAVTSVPIDGTSVESTVTDGLKIDKSGTKYIYDRSMSDVQGTDLDETDLPSMLAEGTFKDTKGANKGDETFQQSLLLGDSALFTLDQPDDMDAGNYVEIMKNDLVYTYTLTFDNSIEFDNTVASADLEGNSLKIQGNTYTITEVKINSSDAVDYLKLVAGDSTVWLAQDQPYTVGDHTVTVVNVDENGESCGVNVDGQTLWIDEGSTEELGGMSVGVIDVKVVHAKDYDQDTCELTLGSNELILENGEPVSVNNVDLEGSEVTFNGAADAWDGFTITYDAGKEDEDKNLVNSDDIFLVPGGAWNDPVFGNFKVVFGGVSGVFEDLEFKSSGDEAELTFMNNDGKEIVVPYHYDGSNIMMGTDDEDHFLLPGQTVSGLGDTEGIQLLYVTTGNEAHVLEIDNVDCNNEDVTIKDVTYGSTVASEEAIDCAGTNVTVTLSGLGTIRLTVTDTAVNYTDDYGDNAIETKYEGVVDLVNDTEFTYFEGTATGDETTEDTVTVNLVYDSADDDAIELNSASSSNGLTWVDEKDGDDDVKLAVTQKGTLLRIDNDKDSFLEFKAPEEDVYAEVFIAPVKGELISGGSSSSSDRVNPFAVGLAVLDEQAESMTKNMIVVGGPCANTVAFGLLNPTNCADGFEEGKAMLKFFERKGKAALLVAGYDAQDTVNAAYVLAQHNKKYSSKFTTLQDEVELVVTDMDQVVFKTA